MIYLAWSGKGGLVQKRENSLATVLLLFILVLLVLAVQLFLQGEGVTGENFEIPAIPEGGDLAVIGGTTAALLTALEAAENGAQVFLFPNGQPWGEDSEWLVEAGLAAVLTPSQQELGLGLTPEMFCAYLEEYGGGINDPLLLSSFCSDAPDLYRRAEERGGLSFSLLPQPEERPYLHSCSQQGGGTLLKTQLLANVEKAGVSIREEKVKDCLLTSAGRVEALILEKPSGETATFYVQAVVLADGGYSGAFHPRSDYLPRGNLLNLRPSQTGAGLRWAEEQALDLVQMSFLEIKLVLLSPVLETVTFLPEELWPEAHFFNSRGEYRRGREASFAQIVHFVLQSPAGSARVMIPAASASTSASSPFFKEYETWGDLVKLGMPGDWSGSAGWQLPPAPPYYVAALQAGVTYTLGGLSITPGGEVKKEGAVVAGLYAAGEIIGGLHGETLLPGMALSETLFTAKVAGQCAAQYAGR